MGQGKHTLCETILNRAHQYMYPFAIPLGGLLGRDILDEAVSIYCARGHLGGHSNAGICRNALVSILYSHNHAPTQPRPFLPPSLSLSLLQILCRKHWYSVCVPYSVPGHRCRGVWWSMGAGQGGNDGIIRTLPGRCPPPSFSLSLSTFFLAYIQSNAYICRYVGSWRTAVYTSDGISSIARFNYQSVFSYQLIRDYVNVCVSA